ncbi:MAG TPA: pyrroline-5-carboxylate reductase [Armatimonadota bacterium]|nr:pyrroline-5-carboxylate reductase [Armatimonadota bacterium]
MAHTYRLGVIGTGNMGAALVRGIVGAGAAPPDSVIVSDADAGRASALAKDLGVGLAATNIEAASHSEYVIVVVKPGVVAGVVQDIAGVLRPEQTLVSMAAGVTRRAIQQALGSAKPAVVRVMPNTPALVGAGMFAVAGPGVAGERVAKLVAMLGAVGEVVEVEETLMDAVTALSGSGPAFVFVMIEALADGGVAAGLPRPLAQQLAVQTVAGAAKLVRETGQHPGALKDAVASPSGTTIAGLAELERGGFRGLVASAVQAAAARSRELSGGG